MLWYHVSHKENTIAKLEVVVQESYPPQVDNN